jgi:putative thiamine transport system permease protein
MARGEVIFRLPLIVLFLAPLATALGFIAPIFFDGQAFAALLVHPQFWGGLWLSVFTGVSSTILALLFAILIAANSKQSLLGEAGGMLAVPHVAVAIGVVFFIVPTGILARLLAWPLGWTAPPQWNVAQDPYGLSLIAALVLKETAFLVYVLAGLMNRADLKQQLAGQQRVATSLGHGLGSVWLRVLLPQLLPRLVWPLVAVFTYGITVVDMALVIGPTQPPTLATVIWRDLNDGEAVTNARGAAGVVALSAVTLSLLLVVGLLLRQDWPRIIGIYSGYPRYGKSRNKVLTQLWPFWRLSFGLLAIFLVFQSFSTQWPFPDLQPAGWTARYWVLLMSNPSPLITSLWLALATATIGVAVAVAWLETARPAQDRIVLLACAATLCLPALVIALGQYRMFLALGLTGTAMALILAHLLPVTAYSFVMLHGPYRGFDGRWRQVSAGLMQSRGTFLMRIKWPLLKAPLLSAWAVGFAVSIAQYVPTQLAAAGRYSTLPLDAVTLSSGGNRALIAVYALALTVLPLLAFTFSGVFGKARWGR